MDPNLEKIRDANRHLIKRGQLGPLIIQAKDYLDYILGSQKTEQIDKEMDEYVAHLRELAQQYKTDRKNRKRKRESDGRTGQVQEEAQNQQDQQRSDQSSESSPGPA